MTPDVKVIEELCRGLSIPVRVMIRSTTMGFEANENILEAMIHSIEQIKLFPVEGFVTGLMKGGRIDLQAVTQIIEAAHPFPLTFHKAIDSSSDMKADIEWINQFPMVDTILTSGGADHVLDGVTRILEMKNIFRRNIMAAGKITPEQLPQIHKMIGLNWYHGQAIV